MRAWRIRGLTFYRRDPGPGERWRHYHGYDPRLRAAFWCRIVGHSWKYWSRGIVIDNGEGPARFAGGFAECKRCEARR